jgi:DNA-binding NarL/FixJ family response regulator
MSAVPRVLIIDDHPGFVDAAKRLLTAEGFDVVGDAPDGLSGVARVQRDGPDVVLLDIQLPDIDGFEVARRLEALSPRPTVVLTSSRDALDYGTRVANAPASGFIRKADLTGEALTAVIGNEAA